MTAKPRVTLGKDPFDLVMDVPGLKDGVYKIEGTSTPGSWARVCDTLEVPHKGEGHAALSLEVAGPVLRINGDLRVVLEQICVRTLEPFMSEQSFKVSETLTRATRQQKAEEDDNAFMIEGDQFDVGDFLMQHVVLNLDPYPIKDPAERAKRGGVLLSDGLDEVVREEKNPFSVLKQLKS
ncbi:MAG: hypothetical protein GC134_02345 [Proteobacteria bacterium]|nr:hypothetical protein [Pseudomonadota bacterium]